MFLVLLMIFNPADGWQRAADASRSITRLLLLHLLPMLLLGCVAEAYGLTHWGRAISHYGAMKKFTLEQVLPYEACHLAAGLVTVLISALMVRGLGNTFHIREKFPPALAVSIFGLGPVFLLRVCDALPAIPPLVPWIIGAVLTMTILYQGVPRVMHLDPSHALGVYMSSMMVLVLASGIGRLLVVYFLQEKILGLPNTF